MGRGVDVLELLSGGGRTVRVLRLAVARGLVPFEVLQEVADDLQSKEQEVTPDVVIDALVARDALATDDVQRLADEPTPQEIHSADATPPTLVRDRQFQGPASAKSPLPDIDEIADEIDPFDALPFKEWDRYEFIEFIGRGGMGVVYKARDPRLDRYVAIKILRRDDPNVLARFAREARVQARIEHDHVCPVYEVDEYRDIPYIAMQYVAGGPLTEISDLLSIPEKSEIILKVADALHAAHMGGLVHRDIKPANIMVERRPDGSWCPYVVDFGIAHDIESKDLTVTGAVLGTPAFAAPEQVRGETKSLDGRTDVYSLGATFYWFLTGHSPFEGIFPEIISGVANDDPSPPHRLNADIPADLDTIILKCLEKDPERRYESAKAVSEDLRRFLDDEPIQARPTSVTYRLGKKIRKHRAASTAIALALAAVVILIGINIRSTMIARKQAVISQRLVAQAMEMDHAMRVASMRPPHDRSAERARIEERMREIEEEMRAVGPMAVGPSHYALGRGQLALQNYEAAAEHLGKAWESGSRQPEVSYALGLALGRVYEKQLHRAQKIEDDQARAVFEESIRERYRDPALRHLRDSANLELEAPTYVEGLIAFYEGRLDDALAKARQGTQKAEGVHETHRLEGDILVAKGDLEARRGEAANAISYYRAAGEAFKAAQNIARSDPGVYDGDCGRWLQTADLQVRFGLQSQHSREQALASCEQSITIDRQRADPYEKTAWLYWRWADQANDSGDDPGPLIAKAEEAATRALEINAESFTALQARAGAATVAGLHASNHGKDPRPDLDRATASLSEAIQVLPTYVPAHDDLGYVYERKARYELSIGQDPRPSLDQAVACYQRAIEINPGYDKPYNNLGIARWRQAVYERLLGLDPSPSLDAAASSLERAIEINRNYANAHAMLGFVHAAAAANQLEIGEDPVAEVVMARQSFEHAIRLNEQMYWLYPEFASAEIVAARWEMRQGRSPETKLDAAQRAVDRARELNPGNSVAYQTAAEVHRWRARWLIDQGQGASSAIAAGHGMIARALEARPRMATALRTEGALLLLEAEADPESRIALAAEADRAFEQAIASNPLLEREVAPLLAQAQELQSD